MGGVFMKKFWKITCLCTLLAAVVISASLLADRVCLGQQLIRLHVVANSDFSEDQNVKLQVRDRVLEFLERTMDTDCNVQEAKLYLQEHLEDIETDVNQFLASQGSEDCATVSLCKETFDVRTYDTFSLPSGVYESLRITIGQGEGKNWWCVVFPRLCLPAVNQDFADTAVNAGFSQELVPTLQQEEGYEVRFFLLDVLGKIENFFFQFKN